LRSRASYIRRAAAVVPVAGLLALSACSSSGGGGSSSPGGSSGSASASSSSGSKAAYTIGYIGSNNPAAAGFNQYYQGFHDYVTTANAAGGANGHKVNVIYDNDQNFDATTELSDYTQLTQQQHALGIIGLTLDNSAPALEARGQQDHIPVILGIAAERQAVEPVRQYVWEFTQIFRNDLQGVGAQATKTGLKGPIAVLTIDSAESRDAATWAKAEFPKLKYSVHIATTQYLPLTATDYTSEVQAAQRAGAKAIVAINSPSGILLIEKAMSQQNYKVPVYGVQADTSLFQTFAKAGIPYSAFEPVKVGPTVPGYGALAKAASAGGNTSLVQNAAYTAGWVGGEVLVQAIKGCGDSCTPETLNSALQSVSNFDTGGFTPPVSFSATDHLLPSAGTFLTLKNGKIINSPFINFAAF
jgi:branched-chain amino acid transport system substrate-binding protein